jgi:hypothetical protein
LYPKPKQFKNTTNYPPQPTPKQNQPYNLSTTNNKMHYKTLILSLPVTLGLSRPIFPVARPYIPNGLYTLAPITTNPYNIARASVNSEDNEIVTGPIPDKWKHTHGKLFQDTEAEKRVKVKKCAGGIPCASASADQVARLLLQKRDMGDCEEGMWGC